MINLDAVRAAALSDRPWDRLDELVRSEMAAGRKVAEIADEFIKMVDVVYYTPGLSEDGGDAFGDTLDALTGNCRSEDCFKDPPNNTLPSTEEIATLPLLARVALTARCARRVLPLLDTDLRPRWGKEYVVTARLWVQLSEIIAGGIEVKRHPLEHFGQLKLVPDVVFGVANKAYYVIESPDSYGLFAHAVEMTKRGADEIGCDITTAIRRDFDNLARLAEWLHWTDDTPVPPDVFGPLWPEGSPPGWPADPDVPQRAELPVAFLALERVIPMILEDEAVNVFNALNRYYIARTGDRLTLDGDIHTLVTALVGAGV